MIENVNELFLNNFSILTIIKNNISIEISIYKEATIKILLLIKIKLQKRKEKPYFIKNKAEIK